MQLLVRNKVRNYAIWLDYFLADRDAAAAYGVTLAKLWQSADDPNTVYFLLNVASIARTNAFMERPESQQMGVDSGVIDGDVVYLVEA